MLPGCIISAPNNIITTICLVSLCPSLYQFTASRLNWWSKKKESLVFKSEVENTKNKTHHLALKLLKKLETLQKNLESINKIIKQNEKIAQIYALDLKSNGDYNAYYNAFNDKITIQITQLETLSALNSTYLSLQNLKGLE